MHTVLFELCSQSLDAAVAGQAGGADQIELCSNLAGGGVTPNRDLTASVLDALSIPVHILIRPRTGSFVFSTDEFDEMRRQICEVKRAGASGVALGALLPNGQVDTERCRALVELARPMAVTFHRAFDETSDLSTALESVISTGADNLLTSGGATDVLSGAERIAALQQQAAGRIAIVAGGGLRLENVVDVARRSGVFSLHGSLTRKDGHAPHNGSKNSLEADVRRAVELLHALHREQQAEVPAI